MAFFRDIRPLCRFTSREAKVTAISLFVKVPFHGTTASLKCAQQRRWQSSGLTRIQGWSHQALPAAIAFEQQCSRVLGTICWEFVFCIFATFIPYSTFLFRSPILINENWSINSHWCGLVSQFSLMYFVLSFVIDVFLLFQFSFELFNSH